MYVHVHQHSAKAAKVLELHNELTFKHCFFYREISFFFSILKSGAVASTMYGARIYVGR